MINNSNHGRAILPLVEITIAIGVLAVCSVITITLFLNAHFAGKLSSDINTAVLKAQSQAEELKMAESPNLDYSIGYDKEWNEIEQEPEYVLTVKLSREKGQKGELLKGTISVDKIENYPFLKQERKHLTSIDFSSFKQSKEALAQ